MMNSALRNNLTNYQRKVDTGLTDALTGLGLSDIADEVKEELKHFFEDLVRVIQEDF